MGDRERTGSAQPDVEAHREATARALVEAAEGNRTSLDALVPQLYQELRGMAHRRLRGERIDHTLCTTALVHEAYLKLVRLDRLQWQNRTHFCAEAARAMRRILIDHAIRRSAKKRGGNREKVEFRETFAITEPDADRLLSLHRALEDLEVYRPRQARIVECRFFAGMTIPEVAEALGLSPATVKRDWEMARAWLNRELKEQEPD